MNRHRKISLKRNSNVYKSVLRVVLALLLVLAVGYWLVPWFHSIAANDSQRSQNVGDDLILSSMNSSLSDSPGNNAPMQAEYEMVDPSTISEVVPVHTRWNSPFEQSRVLEYVKHTIRQGETLWSIARNYNLETYSLISANEKLLEKHKNLPAGVTLKIPNRDGILVTLKYGQTLWDLKNSYNIPSKKILKFNELSSANQLKPGIELFIPGARPINPYQYQRLMNKGSTRFYWPVAPNKKRITSGFGNRYHPILDREMFHRGIDIGGGRGSAVFASKAGEVLFAGKIKGYGYVVTIKHKNSFKTLYGHLSRYIVQKGHYVETGQPIGYIGSTGMATGANLHFEIRKKGKAYDPKKYLP